MSRGRPEPRPVVDVLRGPGGKELVERLLEKLRAGMYPETLPVERPYQEQALFFEERKLLRKAVTWPATELRRLGWELGTELYEVLILTALQKVLKHGGDLRQKRVRAAYYLYVLQDEWRHNRDTYWERSKRHAREVERALDELKARGETQAAREPVQEALAIAHDILAQRPPKALAKKKSRETQAELF